MARHALGPRYRIGDRGGGTFQEAEELGHAVAAEAWKITQAIRATEPKRAPWSGSEIVHLPRPKAPPVDKPFLSRFPINAQGAAEVAALGVGDMALVGEPGEVFAETFVDFKAGLWQMGFRVPMAASYMNGSASYLVPAHAFPEGGYEVGLARRLGLRDDMQTVMWTALRKVIRSRAFPSHPVRQC